MGNSFGEERRIAQAAAIPIDPAPTPSMPLALVVTEGDYANVRDTGGTLRDKYRQQQGIRGNSNAMIRLRSPIVGCCGFLYSLDS